MKHLKSWLAWVLPLLFLLGWALSLHYRGQTGIEVELPVTGYDPRDPISGHYLTYRLAMGLQDPCRPSSGALVERSETRCLCFDGNKKPQPNWAGSCSLRPADCSLYLEGSCEWSGFIVGVERYYFPEGDAWWLTLVPARSTVILALTGSGKALLKEFRPEGRSYGEWIKKQKKEHPKK